MGQEGINEIFADMDNLNRTMRLLEFIRILKRNNIGVSNTVTFLKSLSIDDQLITRIISPGRRN